MRFCKLSLLTPLLVVVWCGVVVAGGWQYTGVGARAKSMGNAFRAISADASNAYYNPAGLAYLETHIFSGTVELHGPRPELDPNFNSAGYNFGYLNGETRYPFDEVYAMGTASLYFQPKGIPNLVLGGSVYQAYDHNAVWNLFSISPAYNANASIVEENHRSNFDVVTFQPTVAYKFSDDKIAVGVGVQIHRGDAWLDQVRLLDNPYQYPLDVRPMDKLPEAYSVDGYGYSVGANIGVQVKLNEKVTLGANYKSKSTMTIDGASVERIFFPLNPGIAALYNDPSVNNNPEQLEIFTTYSTGPEYVVLSDFEFDMTVPSEFGFGISLQPNPRTTLAADFSMTRWSEFEMFNIKFNNRDFANSSNPQAPQTWRNLLTDVTIPFEWDDAFRISLGGERVFNERWTGRIGYMYDDSPIPDETLNTIFIDTGSKHSFNLGATFTLNESISFEGAIEGVFSSSRDIPEVGDVDGDGYWDNFSGDWKDKSFNSSWALNYRF